MNSPKMLFVQCNLNRCKAAQEEIVKVLCESENSLALVSEPYIGANNCVKNIPGLDIYQFPAEGRPVKACIFARQGRNATLGLSQFSTPNLAVIMLTLSQSHVNIASAYVEPEEDNFQTLSQIEHFLHNTKNAKTVLAGDMNGKHQSWGCVKSDARGQRIAEIAAERDLEVCNEGREWTFEVFKYGKQCGSIPDITLVSGNMLDTIKKWHVNLDVCPSSDHNAIVFEMHKEPEAAVNNPPTTRIYRTAQANWEAFCNSCRENVQRLENLMLENKDDLNHAVDVMNQIIKEACETVLGRKKKFNRKFNPWWSEELQLMKREVISTHHRLSKLKKSGRETKTTAEQLNTAKQKYASAIKKASFESFKTFCTRQEKEDVWTVTNRLIKEISIRRPASTVKVGGIFTSNLKETEDALLNKFYPDDFIDPEESSRQKLLRSLQTVEPDSEDDQPFSVGEVLSYLKNMKPSKAPGCDHFSADICQAFARVAPEWLTKMLNKCLSIGYFPEKWKIAVVKILPKPGRKDREDVSAYRPIGLLPIFGKLLEKLMIKRIHHSTKLFTKWRGRQFGFRPQTSTSDALQRLLALVKARKKDKQQVAILSLDIRAAFDNCWWPALLERLREINCPKNIFNLVRSYLQERKAVLGSASKYLTKGCVQGSACGPTFWNLFLDEFLTEKLPPGCEIQAFADDVNVLITASSPDHLQARIGKVATLAAEWGKSVKIEFSPAKTGVIVFTKKSKNIAPVANGVHLPVHKELKLLGLVIDDKVNFKAHVQYLVGKALRIFNNICRIVRPTWGVSPDNVKILFNQVIVPIFTYAAGVWGTAADKKGIQRKLASFQRLIAIRAIRGFRTISATAANALADFVPLHLQIKKEHDLFRALRGKRWQGAEVERKRTPDEWMHPASFGSFPIVEVTTQLEADEAESLMNIFTDGSKLKPKGVGAAYVVFKPDGKQETHRIKLGDHATVFQAELAALADASRWLESRVTPVSTTIFCDSMSAILALQQGDNPHPLVQDTRKSLINARKRAEIKLAWVKAHVGIKGNERADEEAKRAAAEDVTPNYSAIAPSGIKRELTRKMKASWESSYKTAADAAWTRAIFPDLGAIAKFRRVCPTDTYTSTQLLTGHGVHKDFLFKIRRANSAECRCGAGPQTLTHLVVHCEIFNSARRRYIQECRGAILDPFDWQGVVVNPSAWRSIHYFHQRIVEEISKD